MMAADPIMSEILAAVALLHRGDRAGGRSALEAVWSRICDNPEAVHEMTLSHYMAYAQDDPTEELGWDVRALEAASRCPDPDAQRSSELFAVAAFLPSLHANLAEDYFKLGDRTRSKDHLLSAQRYSGGLADDSYGQMIRRGIARLAARLAASEA